MLEQLKDGKDAVGLTCTSCHGGNPVPRKLNDDLKEIDRVKREAHVQPRFPAEWKRDGKSTGANPERTNTLVARESWEFVRFINPGDIRVAEKTCGSSECHAVEQKGVARSMMTHGAMLWGAALYNNGGFPLKDARFGESYSQTGAPQRLIQTPAPTAEDKIPFREAIGMFMRDPRFWLVMVCDTGALIYLWGLNSWLFTYLQQARHFNLLSSGFYSSLPFVLMLLGELVFAKIADWTGRRAAVCGIALFMTGAALYLAAIVPDATTAAWCIALSAGFWGGTTPVIFALGCRIIPAKVTAAGFGVYASIANTIGSAAPFIIGLLVSTTGDFTAGLQFLVACCVVGSLAMIPLMRKY